MLSGVGNGALKRTADHVSGNVWPGEVPALCPLLPGIRPHLHAYNRAGRTAASQANPAQAFTRANHCFYTPPRKKQGKPSSLHRFSTHKWLRCARAVQLYWDCKRAESSPVVTEQNCAEGKQKPGDQNSPEERMRRVYERVTERGHPPTARSCVELK